MKLSQLGRLALLLTAPCLSTSPKSIISYPIGINLGPLFLTSAHVSDEGNMVPLAKVEASNAYKAYFADVLEFTGKDSGPHNYHNVGRAQDTFYTALWTIKTATEKKLGHQVEIGTISQPLFFNESTSIALTEAATQIQSAKPGQITRFTNAARVGYSLNSCEGFGMNATYCDIDTGEHSVVVLDYNKAYLEVALGYVSEHICSVRGYKRVKELGEDFRTDSSYKDQMQKVLQEFVGTYLPTFDFWDYASHVRGVVLSGDASRSGMNEMRQAMAQAFPSLRNRFKHSFEPIYVAAAGAARMAQNEALAEKKTANEAKNTDEHQSHGEL